MIPVLILACLLGAEAPRRGLPCDAPSDGGSACKNMRGQPSRQDLVPVVFVGHTQQPFGWRHPRAAAKVEEIITGLPADTTEIVLHSTDVIGPLPEIGDKAHLVFIGHRREPFDGVVSVGITGPHFDPERNPMLLDALRDAARGKRTITGTVRACGSNPDCPTPSQPRVRLTARNGAEVRTTTVGEHGTYAFRNLTPGLWRIDVADERYSPPPNRPDGYTVKIESGCELQPIELALDGRIEGTVRDSNGQGVADVPVQLDLSRVGGFRDAGLRWGAQPKFAEVRTDATGRYRFQGLIPGGYALGINISSEAEEQPWRPTYYSATGNALEASVVKVAGTERIQGIDLVLPPVRSRGTLWVEAVNEDGSPVKDFAIRVEDSLGRECPGWKIEGIGGLHSSSRPYSGFLGGRYRIFSSSGSGSGARAVRVGTARSFDGFTEVVLGRDQQDVRVLISPHP